MCSPTGSSLLPLAFISVLFVSFSFFLQGVAANLYDFPKPPAPRQLDLYESPSVDLIERTSSHSATLPLAWSVKNQVLFSGKWTLGEGEQASLSLNCLDCQTTGNVLVTATLPDISDIPGDILNGTSIFDQSSLAFAFNGVGAVVDLDLVGKATGDYSLPLFMSETPIGITGAGFTIGVVFTVNLIIGMIGEVDTKGGFQVTIPDNSVFTIELNDDKQNSASFHGTQAKLLPLTIDSQSNITLALQLKVQAGLKLPDLKIVNATALAGAFINIPEIHLDEAISLLDTGNSSTSGNGSCKGEAVTAEFNINAGAFVDIGADIDGQKIGEFNPTATTTLFSAETSTCFGGATSSSSSSACPTGSISKNATATGPKTTSTYSITSCAVSSIDCPASEARTIVVTETGPVVTGSCVPVNATATTIPHRGNSTTTTTTIHKSTSMRHNGTATVTTHHNSTTKPTSSRWSNHTTVAARATGLGVQGVVQRDLPGGVLLTPLPEPITHLALPSVPSVPNEPGGGGGATITGAPLRR